MPKPVGRIISFDKFSYYYDQLANGLVLEFIRRGSGGKEYTLRWTRSDQFSTLGFFDLFSTADKQLTAIIEGTQTHDLSGY